ncbi:HNH endonuclease [Streptomyces sp. NPDC048845]|uniref:HNH endonuclease signature motif containing protein n=1 Tax=Streptomyces sp. NPDC048845 TaxID=3155390 RepID=UPI00343BF4F3
MTSRIRYTADHLARTAAVSTSPADMLERLGVPVEPAALYYLHRRLRHYGTDVSHFTGGPSARRRLLTRASLGPAVAGSRSLAELLRRLGLVDNGTSRRLVKSSIEAYALSTAHFTGQSWRRGLPSPARKPAEALLRKSPAGSARTAAALLRRALLEQGVPHRCAECGLGDTWQNRRLVLEVDHINGDRSDNRPENLRFLCPSCHSQTTTFSRRPTSGGTGARGGRRAQ